MTRTPTLSCVFCAAPMWASRTTAVRPVCRSCRSEHPVLGPKLPRKVTECSVNDCARPVLGRGFCAPHYASWHRSQRTYEIRCKACGEVFAAPRKSSTTCSRKCAARLAVIASGRKPRTWESRPRVAAARRKLERAAAGSAGRRVWVQGRCAACDAEFSPGKVGSARYCDPCSLKRATLKTDRRRARRRNAFVENVYRKKVFEADDYRCHLCGKKTDQSKVAPHPKAPTLDHIVPLAAGGRHEATNCRTAHFLCNSRKGDRGGGEQLLLIA